MDIDWYKLNVYTIPDRQPLSLIDDIFDLLHNLAKASAFTT